MAKYELIPEQLLRLGWAAPDDFHAPAPVAEAWILTTHTAAYLYRLKNLQLTPLEVRATGFPLSEALVHRELVIAQGTLDAAAAALVQGYAFNVAGGTHHAYTDRGEGFCLLNDQAIAANWLLHTARAKRVLVIDLDVHQGQGTAQIFAKEPRVFTFSMHGAANYPHRKETSDLDIPLAKGTNDATYLGLLRAALPQVLRAFRPDFTFYLSGVDVLATDKLGTLALTAEGCRARDTFVFETLAAAGLPVVTCMGGGYSERLAVIVDAHCATYGAARNAYE